MVQGVNNWLRTFTVAFLWPSIWFSLICYCLIYPKVTVEDVPCFPACALLSWWGALSLSTPLPWPFFELCVQEWSELHIDMSGFCYRESWMVLELPTVCRDMTFISPAFPAQRWRSASMSDAQGTLVQQGVQWVDVSISWVIHDLLL